MQQSSKPYRKLLLAVTEDWFVLSHFKPLLRALRQVADEVVVATRDSGQLGEIAALGVRTINFDHARKATAPHVIWSTARRLSALIDRERPDGLHVVALKPIVLAALALGRHPNLPVGVHLTGLGHLGIATSLRGRLLRTGALGQLSRLLQRPRSHLFVENEDDLTSAGITDPTRTTVLGGAGVDPDHFSPLSHPPGPPTCAFVGRLIRSKGVDVLIDAARLLAIAGAPVHLRLYGGIDIENPDAFKQTEIEVWQRDGLASWAGHTKDVREVWRDADLCVAPSRGGEGLPRAVLEAAASSRALIVTDVPGHRRFVRDGVEGLIVPPGDSGALSQAIARLVADADLRARMGDAARRRLLDGFTEKHVEDAVIGTWRAMARGP